MRVVLREGSFKHPGLLWLIDNSVDGRQREAGINFDPADNVTLVF